MTGRAWALLRQLAAEFRHQVLAAVSTGRRWRTSRSCPDWCVRGHHCTAWRGWPHGEHRGEPHAWTGAYGRGVAVGVEDTTGRRYLELRVRVHLDESAARVAPVATRRQVEPRR